MVGAAIGGMLFAAIITALLLMYLIRNRNNNPRESRRNAPTSYWLVQLSHCQTAWHLCSLLFPTGLHDMLFGSWVHLITVICKYSLKWNFRIMFASGYIYRYTMKTMFSLCVQAAQPVERKHQLSRGWGRQWDGWRNRGNWWIINSRRDEHEHTQCTDS